MLFWRSKKSSDAIAYLKCAVPEDAPGNPITLKHDDAPVVRQLAHGLLVTYVVDDGSRYEFIQNSIFESEKITYEQLHSTGLKNLQELAAKKLRVQPYYNIFAVLMGGDFEASLILLDSLWEGPFRQFVKGQFAIAIPARDLLAFCDASSEAGCQELQQLIERSVAGKVDHPLTKQLFLRVGNSWVPREYLIPPPTAPTPPPAR